MEDEDLEMDNGAEDTGVLGLSATDPQAALASLSQSYMGLLSEQQAARQKADATRAARFKAAEEAINQQRFGAPTTSQQLAALSQALLSPRRQRGIAGTFANLAPVFGQMATLQTSAEEKRTEALRQLREQYEVAGEESRLAGLESKREAIEPLIRTYGTLAKPRVPRAVGVQTIGGKTVAVMQDPDTGEPYQVPLGDAPKNLVPLPNVTSGGQPVFRSPDGIVNAAGQPVVRFDPPKEKAEKPRAPSSTELRLITQTEDLVNNRLSGIRSVQQALGLNEQAYEGSLAGGRVALAQLFSSDDPAYVATEQLQQIVKSGVLADLKATFGGNPTEGERRAAMELQANITKPRAVREKFLRRLLQEMQIALETQQRRLGGLKTGQYGQYQQPSTAPAPAKGQPRVINWGN